jgi:hypothetical protein
VSVAIALYLETYEVLRFYTEYLRLLNRDKLMTLYRELDDKDFCLLEFLFHQLKCEGLATK